MPNLDPITTIQLMSGGFYLARSLQVIAELGVADLIGSDPVPAAELASLTGSHPEAFSRVLSLLCAYGIFEKVDNSFRHTETSQFLRSDHPMSMRPFARMFGIPVFWESAIRLDQSVATGNHMADVVTPDGFWAYIQQHPADNAKFNATMQAKSKVVLPLVPAAYDFARFKRIADIGGGRGHLLQTLLNASSNSTGILFDQPHVVAEASAIASDRLHLVSGDFFRDPLPEADAYVLMEVIHDWDDAHSEKILAAVRRSAPPGATLLLIEAMMPQPPVPCWTTTLDIVMLNLLGGKQRNLAEYSSLLDRCGFRNPREIPIGAGHSIIESTAG